MEDFIHVPGRGTFKVVDVDVGRRESGKLAIPWSGGVTVRNTVTREEFERDYFIEPSENRDPQEAADQLKNELLVQGYYGSNALDDEGMRDIINRVMASPDDYVTEDGQPNALLDSLMQQTQWYRGVTQLQDEWRDPSMRPAEKAQRISDAARSLLTLYRQYAGVDINTDELDTNNDGIITQQELQASPNVPDGFEDWAFRVASGANSQMAAIESLILPKARENGTSPFMRSLEQLEREAGAPAVSRATRRGEARALRERYGLDTSKLDLEKMGNDLYMNETSLEDLEDAAKLEAKALYPHMPDGVDYETYSNPFATAYMNILELPRPGYNDPLLRKFLGGAEAPNLGEWEDVLRADGRYEETDGYRRSLFSSMGSLGQTLGFS